MKTIRVSDVSEVPPCAAQTPVIDALRATVPGGSSIEAARGDAVELVSCAVPTHPVVAAFHEAFAGHAHLTLRPDDVWLCIARALADHVATDPEKYRSRFVRHEGRETIRVDRDGFVKGSPDNDWEGCFDEFGKRIAERTVGGWRERLACDFSTTTASARAASDVVLMGAVQHWFRYEVWTRCGIPAVTLEGTPNDWTRVYQRARDLGLAELDLGWWEERLLPVLDRVAATAHGANPVQFWQGAYKLCSVSGGANVTGWVNALFPYVLDRRGGTNGTIRNSWVLDGGDLPDYLCPSVDAYPAGLMPVPFTWNYYGREFPMRFLAGHVGVSVSEQGGVRPSIGWAVGDR